MTAKSVGGCSASLAEAEDIRDRVCCFLRVEDELRRGVVVMPDSSDLLNEACSAGVVQSAAPALVAARKQAGQATATRPLNRFANASASLARLKPT